MNSQRIAHLANHFSSSQKKNPINVTITGGAGQIGYSLVFMIGQGNMFGLDQPINLTLLEIPAAQNVLEGVLMELKDCSFPLLNQIQGTVDQKKGFEKCDAAILIGAFPRKQGMERKDLLKKNADIFRQQGQTLDQYANKDCKILVVGNPANTNCMIAQSMCKNIPRENFTALTRLDQNRAVYQIAEKLGSKVEDIKNVIIWGNHSATQYILIKFIIFRYADINHGFIENYPEKNIKTPLKSALNDQKWGAEIIKARQLSSAASAASAVCDHMFNWFNGTKEGEFVSMGVMSDGSYGIDKGLNFSFPVICKNKQWKIVQGLKWDEFSKEKIIKTTQELLEEKAASQQ